MASCRVWFPCQGANLLSEGIADSQNHLAGFRNLEEDFGLGVEGVGVILSEVTLIWDVRPTFFNRRRLLTIFDCGISAPMSTTTLPSDIDTAVVVNDKGNCMVTRIPRPIVANKPLFNSRGIVFDGRVITGGVRVASGVYVYRLQTQDFVTYKKLVLINPGDFHRG